MMHQCSIGESLAGAALMHHADPPGQFQHHRVAMMLESSIGELLSRAAFMHHDGKGHSALKHYTVLKVLNNIVGWFLHYTIGDLPSARTCLLVPVLLAASSILLPPPGG